MGKKKERTIQICPICGRRFVSRFPSIERVTCSKPCAAEKLRRDSREFRIEPEGTLIRTAKRRAQKLLPPSMCSAPGCGEDGTQVHHKNHNPLDNRRENLERLCVNCHVKHHPKWNKDSICRICGKRAIAKFLCAAHYKRWQIHGDPLIVKDKTGNLSIQSEVLRKGPGHPPMKCVCCERRAVGRGMCHTHYSRWLNHGSPYLVSDRGGHLKVRVDIREKRSTKRRETS